MTHNDILKEVLKTMGARGCPHEMNAEYNVQFRAQIYGHGTARLVVADEEMRDVVSPNLILRRIVNWSIESCVKQAYSQEEIDGYGNSETPARNGGWRIEGPDNEPPHREAH